ncbi:MAG: hypothetical protein Q4F29_00035, partial [Lachnospiraceae bacterium]|nr:hypothetical protein [Lachnospiraceae bacterium]
KQADRSKERHVNESRSWFAFRLPEHLQKSRLPNGIFSGPRPKECTSGTFLSWPAADAQTE